MGYDLHITRKGNWIDEDDNDISLTEWLAYIDDDPELKISQDYWITNPEKPRESMPAPGFCDWLYHPKKESRWFNYYRGNISTKNPDDPTIIKMLSIAKALNAKVQGDDGEVYGISSANEIVYNDGKDNIIHVNPIKKPWWKFW